MRGFIAGAATIGPSKASAVCVRMLSASPWASFASVFAGQRLEGLRRDEPLRVGRENGRHLVAGAHEQTGQLAGLVGRDPARHAEKHARHVHILP